MSDFKITGDELAGEIEAQATLNLIIDRELGHHSEELVDLLMQGDTRRAFGHAMLAERREVARP